MMEDNLYAFSCPNAMVDHNYTDDVALCWADSKEEAIKKFSSIYAIEWLTSENARIRKVEYSDRVVILTDY